MKIFKAIICILSTVVLIWALHTKFGPVPPVGNFINPSTGFWQNAESKYDSPANKLNLEGLHDEVIVKYDDNHVPHIFAKNDHDLYYAQGYVTAADRLWQMDIQTRSASGRLAKVVGANALEIDRYHRRMGMVYGAENSLRGMMKDPQTKLVVEAYTKGINTYIHSLTPAQYPIEFKLLNYKPEEWKPINCALLLKLMSETLAGGSDELEMTNVLNKFGWKVTQDLFPDESFQQEPIIPAGTKWNFKPLTIPKFSPTFKAQMLSNNHKPASKIEGIGSNNWAVSGSKTATGYPILANDPHLHLTFPSIWYQIQLHGPGVNVYGVSLPGAPNIIIGYNQNISWGVTNVDADVLDWYQIKFKDADKNEYWYNNQWRKTTRRIETIKVRGQAAVTENVIYTHFGPVVYEDSIQKYKKAPANVPAGTALRWVAHDESNELRTFYLLNRGNNYADYRKALAFYSAPAQNFIFASADNDIAITPNGKLPLKFKDQGKFILDGTDAANNWQGFIPYEQNPTVKNPPRGFVSSANQQSTDATYPYYINWQFGAYQRGKRINDRLSAMNHITADSMRLLQTDNYSITAYDILPTLLKYIDPSELDASQLEAYKVLKSWNKRFDADAIGATIFNSWWLNVYNTTWRDDFETLNADLRWPSKDRTIKMLLTEPQSKWFDNIHTAGRETIADIVSQAFNNTINELIHAHGKLGAAWQWGKIRPTEIDHLASLPGFGSGKFESGGTAGVINAISGGNGPSWRMVVQLGPKVKGFGIFPGGESGNPGSFYYTNMLQSWKDGKLNELLYLQSATEKSEKIKNTLTLQKK
ncbi:penicillin acylase family protein [Mucilaginibacter lacusdianchii]|uniref:penicillin acylase family protein n=1 Tax=Mucilaginibacter lacusdianchii TaxID=2684211 RepID=UPI00131B6E1B|nr:penicillin acylase family protein [Mucilaginibacter sp. JXJ CY 39]